MWRLLRAIAEQAQQQHIGLYAVGGFARDLLLDIPNHDIDLVVEGDAIALVRAIQGAYGGDMRYHAQFGTAKWLLDETVAGALGVSYADARWPTFIDFVTARTEVYEQPSALPTVERSSIKMDLVRRDFTINTLAIRLSPEPFGELLDFYGGGQDLKDGLIRVLHSLSFVDDPTRMLRAARLEQRLNFRIEPRTEELILGAISLLERVSGDRLRHEFSLILAEMEPLRALSRLDELGVLAAIHPQFRIDDWARAAFNAVRDARATPPWPSLATFDNWRLTGFALFTSRLPEAELERFGRRLQFSRVNLNHLHHARAAIALLPDLSRDLPTSEVVRLLEPLDEVGWLAAWAAAPNGLARQQITRFAREWRFVKPTLSGSDLRDITGIKPGPIYGRLLGRLRAAWLDGEISSPEEEMALLRRLLDEQASEND
jgi:tRNA nucleotidyltransferase (CCA-adding enzyme)